jgi:hypothetical protein
MVVVERGIYRNKLNYFYGIHESVKTASRNWADIPGQCKSPELINSN